MADGPVDDRPRGDAAADGRAGQGEPEQRADAGGRSVWSSPWLWTAVVVVVIGGALVVSFVAGRPADPTADDLSAFCPAVRAYWEDSTLLTSIDLTATPDYPRVKADAARLRQTAPPAIAADAATVAEGIDQLADALAALSARQRAEPGSVPVEEVQRTIDRAGRGRERASERLGAYIQQGCGIDLGAPPPTSAPTGPPTPPTTITPLPGQAGPPTLATPTTGR